MSEVVVVADPHTPTNSIRAPDYPMLESGNLSFPRGRYAVVMHLIENVSSCQITHRIDGAELIDCLLDAGKAAYACIVSSPTSGYRATRKSQEKAQIVEWNDSDLGETPFFTPLIVCTEEVSLKLSCEKHGVSKMWDQKRVCLKRGTRLALGSVIQFHSPAPMLNLLCIRNSPDLKNGQLSIEIQSEPFRFVANVGEDLVRTLKYGGDGPQDQNNRQNIMVHIVTVCLSRLQRDYKAGEIDHDSEMHPDLEALAIWLREQGHRHWSDDEFIPERVATAIYPLRTSVTDIERK